MAEKKEKFVKTTKQQYTEFREEFLRCAKILGLGSWSLHTGWERLEDRFAEIRYDTAARSAIAVFNTEIEKKYIDCVEPKRSARHEAAHLLLADLVVCAQNQKHANLIEKEDEKIVNTIAGLFELMDAGPAPTQEPKPPKKKK